MSYCTWADLAGLTGSTLAAADQAIIIAAVDREVAGLLQKYDLATTSSGDLITAAALSVGKALLIERGMQTGDYGEVAGKAEDASIQRRNAEDLIATYAAQQEVDDEDEQEDVTRCDAVMKEFKLDQTEGPTFYEDLE